jgi:hypothetical protein
MSLFQEASLPMQKPKPDRVIGKPRLIPARVVQPTAVLGMPRLPPAREVQPTAAIVKPRLPPARVVQPTAVIGSHTSQHVMPKTMPKRKKAANHKGGWPGDPSTRQGQGHWPTTEAESSSVQLLKLAQTRVLPPAPPPPPKHGVTVKRLRVSHTPSVSIPSHTDAKLYIYVSVRMFLQWRFGWKIRHQIHRGSTLGLILEPV